MYFQPTHGRFHWFPILIGNDYRFIWLGREYSLEGSSGNFRFQLCLRQQSLASRLVMAGVDLRTVQELLGHKTIAMTCRYAHLAPTHQLAPVERLCDQSEGLMEEPTETKTSTTPIQNKNHMLA